MMSQLIMSIIANAILCAVIAVIIWFYQYYKYEKFLKNFKGPRPLPILGNALEMGSTTDIIDVFVKLHNKYGPVLKIRLGFAPPMLSVIDHQLLEYILRSTTILSKSRDYQFLLPWLGNGLLTGTGARWKKHRKLIAPAFNFEMLLRYIEVFETSGDVLVQKLETTVDEPSVDVYRFITLCTLDIICEATMGKTANAQQDSVSHYVKSVKEMCRIIIARSMSFLKMNEYLYHLSRDYLKQQKAIKILHDFSNSVIQLRKRKLNQGKNSNTHGERRTFLDLLLEHQIEGHDISNFEIREEVDTLVFEGHDTVASAISFTLYCIAKHQNVQDRIVHELQRIFNNSKIQSLTYANLQEMKYLDAVIKETMRLYPSVPIFSRRLDHDIQYGGTTIPANTSLVIFAYGIHRCPETYPDPERFDPDRFLIEDQAKRSLYSFIPFSAGSRNCIGQKFAMLEMKVIISKILCQFKLLPTVPEHQLALAAEVVLKSKNGVCIRLQNRTHKMH